MRRTPTIDLSDTGLANLAPGVARLAAKFELWQHTGSFKPRGALMVLESLTAEQRSRGVVGFSAGNHALALSWAANQAGSTATVVMPRTADPSRIDRVRASGATVELVGSVHEAQARVQALSSDHGLSIVHPFEGPFTVLGTATVGAEMCQDTERTDLVVVPIGGGGLCAGVASAAKLLWPNCTVIGVEPTGADTMRRSLESGSPQAIESVRTIADSLGAPNAEPYTFDVCRRFVDEVVTVEDAELIDAMRVLHDELKLVAEPAGAATTAAFLGPLKERVRGQSVSLIFCGSNVDPQKHTDWVHPV